MKMTSKISAAVLILMTALGGISGRSSQKIYFPNGGRVKLDLNQHSKKFNVRWINIETGEWGESFSVEGGGRFVMTGKRRVPRNL